MRPEEKGISGHSGMLSGAALLQSFEKLNCSGTLLLEQDRGSLLLLLNQGRASASFKLGLGPELSQQDQGFHFQPHEAAKLPQLPSRFPASSLALLRALPGLSGSSLSAASLDFRALLKHLAEQSFSGSLSLEDDKRRGVVLFLKGRIGFAQFETETQERSGQNALRAIYRSCLHSEIQLDLRRLEPQLVASLLGLALDLVVGNEAKPPADFSGLEASEEGYTYYQEGKAYLQIPVELRGKSNRYAPCQNSPSLTLPNEPPDWETYCYQLTLRGRDALNPMTELAMAFQDSLDNKGRELLTQLSQSRSIEELASRLKLQLEELKPQIMQLEHEGLIKRTA